MPDLHRPYIDAVTLPCDRCRGTMARVPEVLDCWFESGAMPFAQLHYPFENDAEFAATFPADFIVEYVAQTRGWFYTLHVLATALFHEHAFKHAVCHGVLLGTDGRKMSKRLQNYPDPLDVVAQHGSDALRVALLSSPVVRGVDIRFKEEAVRDAARRFILPLWNTFHYFTTYAALDAFEPSGPSTLRLRSTATCCTRQSSSAWPRVRDGPGTTSARLRCHRGFHRDAERMVPAAVPFEGVGQWTQPCEGGVLRGASPVARDRGACSRPSCRLSRKRSIRRSARSNRCIWRIGRMPALIGPTTAWPERWSVRSIVRIARGVRERLGIRHRHPLHALQIAGVDAAVIATHGELLKQEVNVKRVEVLSDLPNVTSRQRCV